MESNNIDRKEFDVVYPQFLEFAKKGTVPPKMKDKLALMGKRITGEQATPSEKQNLDVDEVAQLEQMPLQDCIKLFLSVTRCIMGKQDYEYAVKKEAYVKRDAVFAFWHLCYITYSNSSIVITRKKPLELSLEGLRISSKVRKGRNRYSFLLASPKGKYLLGFTEEKLAHDMYQRFRSLLKSKHTAIDKPVELSQSEISSRLLEEETNIHAEEEQLMKVDEVRELLEEYGVEDLEQDHDYRIERSVEHGRVLVHQSNPLTVKIALMLESQSAEAAMDYYAQSKDWNTELSESSVVCRIDQNAYIFYERYKAYGFGSWTRDFVILKTAVNHNGKVYLLEKSVDHASYPPYMTMVRGNIQRKATVFISKPNSSAVLMITKIEIDFGGRTSQEDNRSMALQYLRGYEMFPKYCQEKSFGQGVQKLFNFKKGKAGRKESLDFTDKVLPADVTSGQLEKPVPKVRAFHCLVQSYLEDEIDQELLERIKKNEHERHYLTHKGDLEQRTPGLQYEAKDDFVFKGGDWVLNEQGDFVFVNQKAIDAQKDVIKYIIKQIGTNLFSGKSVMNMSLPVDIFDDRSILERSAASFGYAPIFFKQAAQATDEAEQIAWVAIFATAFTLLELRIQKPFNPILGETFQGYLGGIPVYCEQVSHHPPISSFYMKCAEFTFYGSVCYNVQMGFNSCVGGQSSLNHVIFPNGNHFEYVTPSCEISGLVLGDRKFKLINRTMVIERKKQLFCQISTGKDKPGLYQAKKKQTGCEIVGGVFRVTPEVISRFVGDKKRQKFGGLSKKDVLERLGTIEGSWNGDVLFNGRCMKRLSDPMPYKLQYEKFPLPSNSNYRPDILYKRMGNLAQSQATKQEMQQLQRADRKLRSSKH